MANRKEFKTDIRIGGKEDPSLRKSTNNACKYLKTLSNAAKMNFLKMGYNMASSAFNMLKDNVKNWIDAASDLVETQGKVEAVFKGSTKEVLNWAKTSTSSMGLAQQTALDNAALFGDMATGMGFSTQQAAKMSMRLTQLGADLASFKNISSEQSTRALSGIFTGQSLALTNLGIVMNEVNLAEYAHSKGIRKKLKDMTQAEKVMLRYNFVLEKTKNSHGDYSRTLQGAANQQRTYNETVKNLQSSLGMEVLPYYIKLLQAANNFLQQHSEQIVSTFATAIKTTEQFVNFISNVVNFVQNNATPILAILGGVIGGLVTFKTIQGFQMLQVQMALAAKEAGLFGMIAQGNVIGALKLFTASVWKTVTAIWAQTTALLANPITWVVVGVAALTAGLVALALNWDKVTAAVSKAYEKFKEFIHLKRKDKDTKANDVTPNTPHNALGTHSFVGGTTWVGENGPEKVILPRGSEILSHNNSENLLSKSLKFFEPKQNNQNEIKTGNIIVNLTINGSADAENLKSALNQTLPNIKAQIDAYFRQKQRIGGRI